MMLSALCGAITDLNFNGAGYAWQLVNCVFTAGYSLTLRGIMDKVSSCFVFDAIGNRECLMQEMKHSLGRSS